MKEKRKGGICTENMAVCKYQSRTCTGPCEGPFEHLKMELVGEHIDIIHHAHMSYSMFVDYQIVVWCIIIKNLYLMKVRTVG